MSSRLQLVRRQRRSVCYGRTERGCLAQSTASDRPLRRAHPRAEQADPHARRFPAGGPTDVVARLVSDKVAAQVGQRM